jgi:sigma-B regulation protein RsbU (phosphoserine phosphatase)
MNPEAQKSSPEPRLVDTIKRDFTQQRGFWRTLRRELEDVWEFYISKEQRARLEQMSTFRRWMFSIGWLLKNMLLKLTPLRRVLFLVGVFFLVLRATYADMQGVQIRSDTEILGAILILLVLMLELKDKVLARDELEAGRKVQEALKPARSPQVPGWSLWLFSRPANEVGGDLVDFIGIRDDRLGVALADVTGKGLTAALLMAKLQATIRALAPDISSVSTLLARVNEIIHRDSLRSIFASLLYVEIIPSSGTLRFANAGHHPPLLLRAGTIHEMEKGEVAIGLADRTTYKEHQLTLQTGDVFIAYSDGLTEAQNDHRNFFGLERVEAVLTRHIGGSAEAIGEALISAVDQYIGECRAFDDISLIILKRD